MLGANSQFLSECPFSRAAMQLPLNVFCGQSCFIFLFLGSLFICAASYSKDGGVVVHGFVSYRVGLTTVAKFKVAVRSHSD